MAYGAVPIASSVSSIPQLLQQFAAGQAVASCDASSFRKAVHSYLQNPQRWIQHSQNAVSAAKQFSYQNYLCAVRALLHLPAGIKSTCG